MRAFVRSLSCLGLMLGATSASPQDTSPLANLTKLTNQQSPPGPHIERIKALGDNEWLNLGSPAADPKWGKARGRSWSAKMPYASNLGGAFTYGNGPHAYVKPDGPDAGYSDSDFWFYDINAHRWICLFPGFNTTTFSPQVKNGSIKVNSDGQIVDKDGNVLPPTNQFHGWGNPTYDPDQRKLVFNIRYNAGTYFLPTDMVDGLNALIAQGCNGIVCSPWAYDPIAGTFDRRTVGGEYAGMGNDQATNYFQYISSTKEYFCGGRDGISFYNPATRKWRNGPPRGQPSGLDNGGAYDAKRNVVYIGGGVYLPNGDNTPPSENFWIYDIKTDTWSMPRPTGNMPLYWSSNQAFANFDTVNDVLVIMPGWARQIYIYSPATNSFSGPITPPAEVVFDSANSGFYDPDLNAFFFHSAHDGLTNGTIWVYRYKKATASPPPSSPPPAPTPRDKGRDSCGCGSTASPDSWVSLLEAALLAAVPFFAPRARPGAR